MEDGRLDEQPDERLAGESAPELRQRLQLTEVGLALDLRHLREPACPEP